QLRARLTGIGFPAVGQPDEIWQIASEQHSLCNTCWRQLDEDDKVINPAPMVEGFAPLFAAFQIPDPAGQRNMNNRLRVGTGQLFGYLRRGGQDVARQGLRAIAIGWMV